MPEQNIIAGIFTATILASTSASQVEATSAKLATTTASLFATRASHARVS
jgi:hypothetical protein